MTAVCITATIAEKFVWLLMLWTDTVLFRDLVYRKFLVMTKEIVGNIAIVQRVKAFIAKIGVVIFAENFGFFVTIFLAHNCGISALTDINRNFCFNFVQQLSP
jgi:hypothetical protein